jgi:hypothetical protein
MKYIKNTMKTIIKLSAIIIFALIFNSCKKTNIQTLPPATTSGANTFGCKVNGVVCSTNKYESGGVFSDGIGVKLYGWAKSQDSSIKFNARTESPNYNFNIAFKYDGKLGTYYSEGNNRYMCEFNDYSNGSTASTNGNTYNTDDNHIAKINVTNFDSINAIISGTFEMNAINKGGTIVNITEGRFDIKWQK